VARASAVVFNTERARREFTSHYGDGLAGKFHLVANGCDVPAATPFAMTGPRPGPFVLLHAGSLYGERSPIVVLDAVAAAVSAGAIAPGQFRLRLLGVSIVPPDLRDRVERLGLSAVVEIVPRVSREQSLREMASASALLLLQQGHALSVPAKTYEYLASGRPILAIAGEGATADVVTASGAGIVVRGDRVEDVQRALVEIMTLGRTDRAPVSPQLYDGAARARELAALVAAVARRAPAVVGGTPVEHPARSGHAS
jgi:glycosyltransferase involved in cell wall biosynthesis